MNIQLAVDDWLVHSQTTEEIQNKLTTGLILVEYLNGEISIGEVAEHLKKTIEETLKWLNDKGVDSSRLMSQNMEDIARKNMVNQLKERGFKFPEQE
ncbi:MAG: hypothetical protein KZQ83_07355 [gamma proteobacterium symbiont of Taylorina sp.]|nr:hypothetical protein [gamma proteobacterium symbiont of Taylorina sp.]